MPYRLPTEMSQVDKSQLYDYLLIMKFFDYQKINNSIAIGHSGIPKTTKDMHADKKSDTINLKLSKDKELINLPKTMNFCIHLLCNNDRTLTSL